MTILILGGAGFIGKNLSRHFIQHTNHSLIIFDRPQSDFSDIEQYERVTILKGHFNEKAAVEAMFERYQIDCVIHLISAIVPETDLVGIMSEINDNLINTVQLIAIMQKFHVGKLVFFSSGGAVYGNNGIIVNDESSQTEPINSYGWIKLTIEKYIKMTAYQTPLKYLIIRPSNPYGRFQNIYGKQGFIGVTLGKIASGKPVEIWGDGSVVRDYIYIDDLCRYIDALLTHDHWNETFNIASGDGYSLNELLNIISGVTHITPDIIYKQGRGIDIPRNLLNISKIRQIVGFFPKTTITEGITLTWEWLKLKQEKDQL